MTIPRMAIGTLLVLVLSAAPAFTQDARRNAHASYPAGGAVSVSVDPREAVPSLDMLIHMSLLIVDATVADVLPAVASDPNPEHPSAETHSLITVQDVLSDVFKAQPSSLYVVQVGGKVGNWEVTCPDAPLLVKGERQILFLQPDDRPAPFATFGVPRYLATGAWSGLVSVAGGKIQFLPKAVQELHKYDGMSADAFLSLLRERVKSLVPKNQIIAPKWCAKVGPLCAK